MAAEALQEEGEAPLEEEEAVSATEGVSHLTFQAFKYISDTLVELQASEN